MRITLVCTDDSLMLLSSCLSIQLYLHHIILFSSCIVLLCLLKHVVLHENILFADEDIPLVGLYLVGWYVSSVSNYLLLLLCVVITLNFHQKMRGWLCHD